MPGLFHHQSEATDHAQVSYLRDYRIVIPIYIPTEVHYMVEYPDLLQPQSYPHWSLCRISRGQEIDTIIAERAWKLQDGKLTRSTPYPSSNIKTMKEMFNLCNHLADGYMEEKFERYMYLYYRITADGASCRWWIQRQRIWLPTRYRRH